MLGNYADPHHRILSDAMFINVSTLVLPKRRPTGKTYLKTYTNSRQTSKPRTAGL